MGQVVKLYVKLGKPIPEIQPIKPQDAKENKEGEEKKNPASANRNHNRKTGAKRPVAPKITFIGGTKLTTTGIVKSDQTGSSECPMNQTQAQQASVVSTAKDDDIMEISGDADHEGW